MIAAHLLNGLFKRGSFTLGRELFTELWTVGHALEDICEERENIGILSVVMEYISLVWGLYFYLIQYIVV